MTIDVTAGFDGDVIGSISVVDAARRVIAYCTTPSSGWGVYDLAGIVARRAGVLDVVAPWSLLWANLLNGNVTLDNVAAFDFDRRRDFARMLRALPPDVDLADMIDLN